MGLTDYIKEDLNVLLTSEEGLPCRLTLAALAEHYDVSLTPVRDAVATLIAEGVLHKKQNGRLAISPLADSRRAKRSAAITPPRSASDWDTILVKQVMHASLRSEAVYLREEALAHEHGVGRSVIRQSLGRMAGAGLIEHVPRCGWRVHPIRDRDVAAYLEIREALELKALDLARPNLETHELERMLRGNAPSEEDNSPRLDNRLHAYLIRLCGNRFIQNFFRQYAATYYTAVFDYATPHAHVKDAMAAQHCRILQAMLAKRWVQAQEALSEHIWAQRPILRTLLNRHS